MSKAEMREVIRSIHEAIMKNDGERLASFFTEDATSIHPLGIEFKGPDGAKIYLKWIYSNFTKLTLKETGLIIERNKAAHEFVFEGTSPEGLTVSFPAVAIYEFRDGKVQTTRVFYDVLSIAKQGAKGWLAKRAVKSIEKQFEKGLYQA